MEQRPRHRLPPRRELLQLVWMLHQGAVAFSGSALLPPGEAQREERPDDRGTWFISGEHGTKPLLLALWTFGSEKQQEDDEGLRLGAGAAEQEQEKVLPPARDQVQRPGPPPGSPHSCCSPRKYQTFLILTAERCWCCL